MSTDALQEVVNDAQEQYGTVGAMAYTVKQAKAELKRLQAIEEWAERAFEWFEDHDVISVNSEAYQMLVAALNTR